VFNGDDCGWLEKDIKILVRCDCGRF